MSKIIVEVGEYEKARAPDTLLAGFGPCIVIGAIYGKKGYMFHHAPCNDYYRVIKPIFSDLRRDVRNRQNLKLYVAGGEIVKEDYEYNCVDDVLKRIRESDFEKCVEFIRWCMTGFCQDLELILDDGVAGFNEDREDELLDN